MIPRDAKIFIAGHRGMVGSAITRKFEREGYTRLLNRTPRELDLRTERFNQHETPGSLLVEVGASGNTLAEALRSARILGNALVKLIRGEAA